jgi:WbqC-like protein family
MRIAICQPTYLPWLGYFDLMDQVDTFVVLDNVQFEKQSWQQRNRIKTPAGLEWLTVPVKIKGRSTQVISDVEIAEPGFCRKHLNLVRAHYQKASFFERFFPELSSILNECCSGPLATLNLRLIKWFMASLGIDIPVVLASKLRVEGKRTALNLAICERLSATKYFSAIGSAVYLLSGVDSFTSRGIEVCFQNYTHPEYQQLFPPFFPYASTLDLIFNEGSHSLEVICRGRGRPFSPAEVALQQRVPQPQLLE